MRNTAHFAASPAEVLVVSRRDIRSNKKNPDHRRGRGLLLVIRVPLDLVAILPGISDLQANGVAAMFKPVGNAYLVMAAIAASVLAYGALAQDDSGPIDAPADELTAFESQAFDEGDGCPAVRECDCLGTRPTLTGNWFGLRSCLQESGVTFAGRVTQFAFGIDGGINTPLPPMLPLPLRQGDTFKYTGRGEYDLIFDLEKFGGLPHGSLLVRAEHWYG
jgi:hypothetical protein